MIVLGTRTSHLRMSMACPSQGMSLSCNIHNNLCTAHLNLCYPTPTLILLFAFGLAAL